MDHLARKTSISLTTRPKALKDVSITNTFTISLSSSMQACKAKESLLQVEDEASPPRRPRASYYQNFSILAAWQTLQHWWQQTANQSRRRQPHKKCVDKWKRAKVFLTLHSLKFLRRAALFLNASRDMDIFHILYHCKAALKNEGEQRQKVHNCLAKRKLADRVFFSSSLRSWSRQVVLPTPRPSSSPHTLFLVCCCILFGHDVVCCHVETAIFPPHNNALIFQPRNNSTEKSLLLLLSTLAFLE